LNLWFKTQDIPVVEDMVCLGDMILQYPANIVAEQLTLINFKLFKKLEPHDLMNQCWSKKKLQYRANHVLSLIQRSNRVSYWVATMILSQGKTSARAKMIEKLIDVCKGLDKLNNYDTLMAFVIGMRNSSITRLKKTLRKVTSAKLEMLKKYEKMMDAEGSHAAYRRTLEQASPPCIPFLGVSLSDLTFIEDGNPDEIEGMVNFAKRTMMIDSVLNLQQYQNIQFKLERVQPLYAMLQQLPFLEYQELYKISTLVEPRERKDSGTHSPSPASSPRISRRASSNSKDVQEIKKMLDDTPASSPSSRTGGSAGGSANNSSSSYAIDKEKKEHKTKK